MFAIYTGSADNFTPMGLSLYVTTPTGNRQERESQYT